VRDATLDNFRKLIILFGQPWAQVNFFPVLFNLTAEVSYLRRLTSLFAMQRVADVVSTDQIKKHFMPILVKMKSDRVANVRFGVCKTL
jgi:serine/threonine-protein phosphatase 2A regulatory subunit A